MSVDDSPVVCLYEIKKMKPRSRDRGCKNDDTYGLWDTSIVHV